MGANGALRAVDARFLELIPSNSSRPRTLRALLGVSTVPVELRRAIKQARQGKVNRVAFGLKLEAGRLELHLEVHPASAGARLELERALPGDTGVRPAVYEVSIASRDFGRLRAVNTPRGALRAHGIRCYEHFAGAATPCVGCPALALKDQPSSKRESGVIDVAAPPHWVAHAERHDNQVSRVVAVPLSESALGELFQLRIRAVGERAGLSDRERSVLDLVLLGRSFEQIGGVLRITPRTVRFHLANILAKVGADSRTDLVRLFL